MTCSAIARALARSPELNAGCPQQLCAGTSTAQPASSMSLTAAKPIEGRTRSTRQVTRSPTRGFCCGSFMRYSDSTRLVTPGLGPGVPAFRHDRQWGGVDCRVKPGNDAEFCCRRRALPRPRASHIRRRAKSATDAQKSRRSVVLDDVPHDEGGEPDHEVLERFVLFDQRIHLR